MVWRIGRNIFSVQSACWFSRLVIFTAVWLGVASGQTSTVAHVHDCHPCLIAPGGQAPRYAVTFVMSHSRDGRFVSALDVINVATRSVQRLPVTGMEPLDDEEDFVFGARDVNFDGFLDMELVLRSGGANASVMYWLFNPGSGSYDELGVYPEFQVDSSTRRLKTYERGGFGGFQYHASEYAFVGGKLTLVREERQDPYGERGEFRKVIRERQNGTMTIVTRTTLKPPPQQP